MEFVYICSPYKSANPKIVDRNVFQAFVYCRLAYDAGYFPIAPHCYLPKFIDDGDKNERKKALQLGLKALKKCSEIWVFGERITEGMRGEIKFAKENKIKIRYFTRQGEED